MPKATQNKGIPKGRRQGVFGHGGSSPRAALYARVSTHDQQTLPMQLSTMREYARKREWAVTLEIKDVGSGATLRQKREELLAAARRREVDVIIVWRLDRWGGSLGDLVTTLQELSSLKVGFVSLTEALDLTTPGGRALAGMLAVFAEFERDILRDRVEAGIAQAPKRRAPAWETTFSGGSQTGNKEAFQNGNQEAFQNGSVKTRDCQSAQDQQNLCAQASG